VANGGFSTTSLSVSKLKVLDVGGFGCLVDDTSDPIFEPPANQSFDCCGLTVEVNLGVGSSHSSVLDFDGNGSDFISGLEVALTLFCGDGEVFGRFGVVAKRSTLSKRSSVNATFRLEPLYDTLLGPMDDAIADGTYPPKAKSSSLLLALIFVYFSLSLNSKLLFGLEMASLEMELFSLDFEPNKSSTRDLVFGLGEVI